MTEQEALDFGNQQLAAHGLTEWHIQIRPGKLMGHPLCSGATLMRADRKSGVIILRTRDVLGMSDDEVRETILHEIAHAIVAPEESGHGPKWKATARSLGCRDNPFGADPLTLELAKLIRKARRL